MAPSAIGPYSDGILNKVLMDGGFITAADMRYHFFVMDHLGNVRVVVNDAGVVEQVNQFYPYGESIELDPASANPGLETITENPYKWSGKEWDEEQGAYDFGARMYSASDARWTTMDPLSERYYHISPYAYCAGIPVNLVDPDGRDVWEVDKNGVITWKEESDEHTLYYVDADGNKNSIAIKNRKILDVLSSEYYEIDKKGNRNKGTGGRDQLRSLILQWKKVSSSYTSSSDDEDLCSLFIFLADNTSVEWVLHMDDESGITLGTRHNKDTAGNKSDYGLKSKAEQSIHSHPDQRKEEEWSSMRNDIYNVRSGYRAPISYVYFPVSGAVWQLAEERRDGKPNAVKRTLIEMIKAHNRH